jgi:hypothetical protein
VIPYSFHPEAEWEFQGAALYYESQRVGLGKAFYAEVARTIALIRQFPDAGVPVRLRNDGWWSIAFPTQLSIAETRRRSLSSPLHTIVGALVIGGIAAAANMRMNPSARAPLGLSRWQ